MIIVWTGLSFLPKPSAAEPKARNHLGHKNKMIVLGLYKDSDCVYRCPALIANRLESQNKAPAAAHLFQKGCAQLRPRPQLFW
ncbi:hypothetical protein B0T13DRAFT_461978 [Neurospora crassa]|nr:hypothetical protein B0T13DRAFT_461978 [Neurospora crassa]